MTYSFNLIDEPWIPCLSPDNTHQELGIHNVLKNQPGTSVNPEVRRPLRRRTVPIFACNLALVCFRP